jgi:hypothetical protein
LIVEIFSFPRAILYYIDSALKDQTVFFIEFFYVILQAQPSPTTGKFSFFPTGNTKNSTVGSDPPDKSKETFFDNIDSSSFAFKPMGESGSFFLGGTSKVIALGSLAFYIICLE